MPMISTERDVATFFGIAKASTRRQSFVIGMLHHKQAVPHCQDLCRSTLSEKEVALAAAQTELERRIQEIQKMASTFDASLNRLNEADEQLKVELEDWEKDECRQRDAEAQHAALIAAAEQSAQDCQVQASS